MYVGRLSAILIRTLYRRALGMVKLQGAAKSIPGDGRIVACLTESLSVRDHEGFPKKKAGAGFPAPALCDFDYQFMAARTR